MAATGLFGQRLVNERALGVTDTLTADSTAGESIPGQSRPRPKFGRRSYCPICGEEQLERPVSEPADVEDPFCSRLCADAWLALVAVRLREEGSTELAARRRREFQDGDAHAPVLSELLLERWRAGDWTVPPESLLARL